MGLLNAGSCGCTKAWATPVGGGSCFGFPGWQSAAYTALLGRLGCCVVAAVPPKGGPVEPSIVSRFVLPSVAAGVAVGRRRPASVPLFP